MDTWVQRSAAPRLGTLGGSRIAARTVWELKPLTSQAGSQTDPTKPRRMANRGARGPVGQIRENSGVVAKYVPLETRARHASKVKIN